MDGPYINLEYTTINGDGKFTGKTRLFFYKPMTLIAYYPFTGTEGEAPGIITASTTVGNQTTANQPKIDFLWDSKTGVDNTDFSATNPKVNFTFAHRMSKLSFTFMSSEPAYEDEEKTIMKSDGVDVRTMVKYEIEGLGIKGTFNTATGECSINETEERQGLAITVDKIEPDPNEEKDYKYKTKRECPSLIVFPQKKAEDGFILHITTNELNNDGVLQKYRCALKFTDDEIKSGCHYKFTIQVTRRGLIVGNLTIEPWVGSQKFIVATIDGNETPKDVTPAENP